MNKFKQALLSMLIQSGEYFDKVYYAHIIMQCNFIYTTKIDTIGISFENNCYNLYINSEYINKLSIEEIVALLIHESLHILNGHIHRKDDKDKYLWNISTDCAINQLINLKLPKGGVTFDLFSKAINEKIERKREAEYYYDQVAQKQVHYEITNIKFQPTDDHSNWKELSDNEIELAKMITCEMIREATERTISCDKYKIPYEVEEWLKLNSTNYIIDWKKELRNIILNKRTDYKRTILRRNRRFRDRLEIKGKIKDRKMNLLTIIDVSGSIDDDELVKGISEIVNLCKVFNIEGKMIQIDTLPKDTEKINSKTLEINRKAIGGTYLYPAIEKIKKEKIESDVIVIVTDGHLFDDDIEKIESSPYNIVWLFINNNYDDSRYKRKKIFMKEKE